MVTRRSRRIRSAAAPWAALIAAGLQRGPQQVRVEGGGSVHRRIREVSRVQLIGGQGVRVVSGHVGGIEEIRGRRLNAGA